MAEYLQEWRDRWNDPYFLADHQIEVAVLVALAAGSLGLMFKYLELRMIQGMSADA